MRVSRELNTRLPLDALHCLYGNVLFRMGHSHQAGLHVVLELVVISHAPHLVPSVRVEHLDYSLDE